MKTSKPVLFTNLIICGSFVTALLALVGLSVNINNWAHIARNSVSAAGGSVGLDSPFWLALILAAGLLTLSLLLTKGRFNRLQIATLAILACVLFIWFAGLGFATGNPYQLW